MYEESLQFPAILPLLYERIDSLLGYHHRHHHYQHRHYHHHYRRYRHHHFVYENHLNQNQLSTFRCNQLPGKQVQKELKL